MIWTRPRILGCLYPREQDPTTLAMGPEGGLNFGRGVVQGWGPSRISVQSFVLDWHRPGRQQILSTLSLSKVIPQFFIRGFSSNKPLIFRINVLGGSCNIPHLPFCCMNERAQTLWACFVSQVRWKERRKREEGAIKFYNFLLSPHRLKWVV